MIFADKKSNLHEQKSVMSDLQKPTFFVHVSV